MSESAFTSPVAVCPSASGVAWPKTSFGSDSAFLPATPSPPPSLNQFSDSAHDR